MPATIGQLKNLFIPTTGRPWIASLSGRLSLVLVGDSRGNRHPAVSKKRQETYSTIRFCSLRLHRIKIRAFPSGGPPALSAGVFPSVSQNNGEYHCGVHQWALPAAAEHPATTVGMNIYRSGANGRQKVSRIKPGSNELIFIGLRNSLPLARLRVNSRFPGDWRINVTPGKDAGHRRPAAAWQ